MTSPITCFLLVVTDRWRVSLRRWRATESGICPKRPGCPCEGKCVVAEETHATPPTCDLDPPAYPPSDPRWPAACAACGRTFGEGDARQAFREEVYVRADGAPGDFYLREMPPGAMYDATWLRSNPSMRGPDGRSLMLVLPDGRTWAIDGRSKNGPGWTRTGEAPRITARPSILTEGYHGFLTDGVLTSC